VTLIALEGPQINPAFPESFSSSARKSSSGSRQVGSLLLAVLDRIFHLKAAFEMNVHFSRPVTSQLIMIGPILLTDIPRHQVSSAGNCQAS
jgi:hypothetical protein